MQVNKLFFGLFVCASLCACSNDDSGISPNDSQKVFTGDEAYINVRLADAGSLSRATTEDPGYEYGTTDEHAVKNAYFYFYDANGVYVSQGSAWNGGDSITGNPAGNIEFKGKNVVVLKGLEKKNYPKYMVTVLNCPSDFEYGQTLDEMEKKLSGGIYARINNTNYFAMSTTSWAGQKNTDGENMKYFVTEVKETNFSPEPIDDADNSSNYVTVYVERLAAKITLNVDNNALKPIKITGKDGNYYAIKTTVAGDGNSDDANASKDNQIAAEDLYVRLLGWKLNATAKDSYIVKNIDETWSDSELGGFGWNKPSDFRSFWGKSYNYGIGTYPENATGAAGSQYLEYVNLSGNLKTLGSDAYCAENTNTSDIVTANFPSAVTSILLKAEVCDTIGNPLNLVRFNGVLFKEDAFNEYIINCMNTKGKWNVWVETSAQGATVKTYASAGAEYVKLIHVGDGKVQVQLNATGTDLYARSETSTENNVEYTFNKIEDAALTTIDDNLAAESADAIGYNGGLMYYNIPIEHLNNSAVAENGTIPEAKYGVVRNHHYIVTINKLEKIGKGIFNETEIIVPGKDDDKEAYYVGASINILSWKIVNQSVEL